MTESVLTKFYRTPKQYVTLPSDRKYYDDIKLSMTGDLPILPMTAADEMLWKNPDALLNGDSVIRVIKSCCPDIPDPTKLIATDIEVILLGILFASFDDNYSYSESCPKCKTGNDISVPIMSILDTVKKLDPPYIIEEEIKINDTLTETIKIYVKPFTYAMVTKSNIAAFEHQKMYNYLIDEETSDEKKLKLYGESIEKLSIFTYESIVNSIEKIETDNGVETNSQAIAAWAKQAESSLMKKIDKMVKEINSSGVQTKFDHICQNKECEHKWETEINIDPSFFLDTIS